VQLAVNRPILTKILLHSVRCSSSDSSSWCWYHLAHCIYHAHKLHFYYHLV